MNRKDACRAFSNEQRLKLLLCLSRPKNVTELLDRCPLSQSALSQHLKVLRDAGIVKAAKEGREVIYSVANEKASRIARLLLEFK